MSVKVNRAEWDKLSAIDKKIIEDVIGGYFNGTEVVPDSDAPGSEGMGSTVGSFCETACNVAQAAAEAACQAIKDPLGKAVCMTLAKEAGDLCRSKC